MTNEFPGRNSYHRGDTNLAIAREHWVERRLPKPKVARSSRVVRLAVICAGSSNLLQIRRNAKGTIFERASASCEVLLLRKNFWCRDGRIWGGAVLTVGSTFSGVGGIDLGLERAGMRVVFQAESDAWCRRILAQHWPDVPCFEDVRDVGLSHDAGSDQRAGRDPGDGSQQLVRSVDVIAGGFPCQDLSVAGRRAGFAGDRSSLFFEFARIAGDLVRPGGWVLIENVPGLLSSHNGRDFAVLLATLAELGFHDLAWRVLDSRYFGVPQRRRRVFIVGRRAVGDGARQVLLEPESGGGDFAPSREARSRVAASLSRGSHGAGVRPPGRRQEDDENIVGVGFADGGDSAGTLGAKRGGGHDLRHDRAGAAVVVAPAIVKRYAKGTDSDATDALIAHTLRAEGFDASEDGTGRGTPLVRIGESASGSARDSIRPSADAGRRQAGAGLSGSEDRFDGASTDPDGMRATSGLSRRVDDPQPDGPRYAAMGNAVTVPVATWIGRRIVAYEEGRLAA